METKLSHVLVFPYPSQGHINPMLQFAKRLASKGLRVTLIILTSSKKPLQVSPNSIYVEPIDFEEGENAGGFHEYVQLFMDLVPGKLVKFIEKKKTSQYPPKFVVYDAAMPWTLDVARNAGIDGGSFFTQPWAVCSIYYHMHKGSLRLPLEECKVSLPSMPTLEVGDLPSFVHDTDSYPLLSRLVSEQFLNFEEANWHFCNTFDKLEEEVLKWMSSHKAIKTIGPTIPSMFLDKKLEDDNEYGFNLFKPDVNSCIKWLDSRDPGSVVYVSFGSMAVLGEEQMEEIAWGLRRSNSYFLWVVRESEQEKLPIRYMEESSEKGLVVSWSPQLRVLAHKAVGCFVTHCGWNSILEALSLGVPMIAIPLWSDQPTNAKFIEDVWKVGVRAQVDENGVIKKWQIERCIKEVMEGEKSVDIKKNSETWMNLAIEAFEEGGSSNRNLQEFVAHLVSK